ncbi:MAP kinase-interacting serine/threonine-protein kinase 1 [Paramyrothecium foliicola]|nr:MAP kinase-interacting serine/threonine-protein kinase 1 [Paramyrothecium foliicola]
MCPDSQSTVENNDASRPAATITLTPDNAEARLAFSEVAEWLNEQAQHDAQDHARKYMWVDPEQSSDPEVTRLLRELIMGDSCSSSSTSPPTSPRQSQNGPSETDLDIWTGFYYVALDQPPLHPLRGWVAGAAKANGSFNDLVLGLQTSTSMYRIRRHQAVFQIHSTGRVSIQTMSDRSDTSINGTRILRRPYILNEPSCVVTFGSLRYRLQYSSFARTPDYRDHLKTYLTDVLGNKADSQFLSLTPTPSEATAIKIGHWSITSGTVGSGAVGRVSIAIDNHGKVTALKRISVGRNRSTVTGLRRKLETLTRLAEENDESRILRLLEVLTDDAKGANSAADVWFVLEPAVADTLFSMALKNVFSDGHDRLDIITMVLVDILEAVAFLHKNGWFHSDLKPANIGIQRWNRTAPSIVLLDLDSAQRCPSGKQIRPSPGTGGTVGYLSPEREMTGYDESSDVWSIGVIALWMIHGRHPWKTNTNPWRPGDQYAREQVIFFDKYKEAVASMERLAHEGLTEAILGMIRHPYAKQAAQRETRFSAAEALGHVSKWLGVIISPVPRPSVVYSYTRNLDLG